jgi:XisH protein
MTAKDRFHEQVKQALLRDQWTVTENFQISFGGRRLEIDFGAERLILADRGLEKIAIEVKSFLNPSPMTDFHNAVGQFLNYRVALKRQEPDRQLYLAVPLEAYKGFFQSEFVQVAIEDHGLRLMVYDPVQGVIEQWIN